MENKTVYLSNGDQVTLMEEFKFNGKSKYIVLFCEDQGDYGTFEELQIVDAIFDSLDDTPQYKRKSELEKEIGELWKEKEDLLKTIKHNKIQIAPKVMPGGKVYVIKYNGQIEEKEVYRVSIYLFKDKVEYGYYDYSTDTIYNPYFTEEEAKQAAVDFNKNFEAKEKQRKLEEYQKAQAIVKSYEGIK